MIDYDECIYDDDQGYRDYMEYSFYEFLYSMKNDCIVPKTHNPSNNLKSIHRFWEVDVW